MSMILQYDFLGRPALTGHLGPDLSITRATTATMTDADGYIREVQAGEARFTGATFNHNLFLQSNNFDTTWVQQNIATPTGGQSDPDGGSNAWLLVDDSGGGAARVGVYQTISFTGPRAMVAFKAKANGLNYAAIEYDSFGSPATNSFTFFNLTDGTTNAASGATAGTVDLGGGWYWCYTYFDARTSNIGDISIRPSRGTGVTEDRDGTSSIYIYQAQAGGVSTSVSTPNTYIDTTTAAVSSLTGTSTKGLLVEKARTNLCLQSEDFSTTWTNLNSIESTNATTAPDGASTADEIIDDSGGGTGNVAVAQSVTVSTSTTYAFSFFAKASQLDWVAFQTLGFTTPGNVVSYWDLTNGVTGTAGSGHTSSIEDYGNGWYRCITTFTTDATDDTGTLRIFVAEADNDAVVDLDGTSSIFVWGAQLEAGAFPRSYIATTTASVTRNADDVKTTTVSWYNESALTFYASGYGITAATGAGNSPHMYSLSDGLITNNVAAGKFYQDARAESEIRTAAQSLVTVLNVWDDTSIHRLVTAGATDDHAFYVDGTAATPDTTNVANPTSVTTFRIGCGYAGPALNNWNGHIAEIRYWDERFPNDTLALISQGIFPASGHTGIGLGFGKMGAQGAQ